MPAQPVDAVAAQFADAARSIFFEVRVRRPDVRSFVSEEHQGQQEQQGQQDRQE